MKKLLSIMLAVALVFSGLIIPASAHSITDSENIATIGDAETTTTGDYTYTILEDGTACITDYTGNDAELYIPSMLDGYVVTSIGDSSFSDCVLIENVIIPDTVTNIGYGAFNYCRLLKNITIPDSVKTIGSYVFNYCNVLESVTIPDSVESLGSYAFNYCISLKSVKLSNSLTAIADGTFYGCKYLEDITIPQSVQSIGKDTFNACHSLESIVIPDGVTTIQERTFGGCDFLKEITIPDSVTTIEQFAFYLCSSLDKTYYKGTIDQWVNITFGASYDCYWSGDLYIDNELVTDVVLTTTTKINARAFSNCSSLKSVTIPNTVTAIGSKAFEYCTSLTDIKIPESVKYISYSAFKNCIALKEIEIPNSVTTIEDSTFYGCTALENVTIPNSVTQIKDDAFQKCTSLATITIPDSVKTIGGAVFYECTSLTDIVIPDSVTTIEGSAFARCKSLKSVTLSKKITNIGYACFQYCDLLTEIVIPEGVTTIGNYAFSGCTSLTEITIPDSVTSINQYAFEYCKALTKVVIPYTTTYINYYAFTNCSDSLTIYGYSGSTAEDYANNNGINFVSLNVSNLTAEATNKTISLSWDKFNDAVKYWVFVNGVCYGGTTQTSYSIANRKADTTYSVQITAMLTDGSMLPLDKAYSTSVTTLPEVVANGTAQTGLTTATLSWDSLEGATKYWIYLGNEDGTEYSIYKSTTGNSLALSGLDPSSTYYFKVTAFVDGKVTSLDETQAIVVNTTNSTPTVTDTTDSSITLSWNESENADKYWVMVSNTNDSSDLSAWRIVSTTDTTYTISGLDSSTQYDICIRARYEVNGAYKTSDYDIITHTTL